MRLSRILPVLASILFGVSGLPAASSGALGIYGIVEKVVIEPAGGAPQRIQVWGAFCYAEGNLASPTAVSAARRGYLYFRMPTPEDGAQPRQIEAVRNEWNDLKAVAGTGQAVGFGSWGYIGRFEGLLPDAGSRNPPYILERSPGNPVTDMRVRPAAEAAASPAMYHTEIGMVKLSETGSHAAVVKQLREALKR